MKYYSLFITFLLLCFVNSTNAQKMEAYQLFSAKGKKITFKKGMKKITSNEIILFGEFHNNPISHWLQLEVVKAIFDKEIPLVIGAEMFERDNEIQLQKYLNNELSNKEFSEQVRLWSNYATDYEPLLEFAKEQRIAYVATNIPRRFANKVYKEGGFGALESLNNEEKSWMPPLPIPFDLNLKTYQEMLQMMGGEHANPDIVKAQAIKDASMAYFILENLPEDGIFLHLNGSYHSNFYEGIVWYLNAYNNKRSVLTIATVEQDDINKLDENYKNIADIIICVPSTMTKTY